MSKIVLDDAQAIVEHVTDVKFERYPDWSRDQLLVHPKEAILLCAEVRKRSGRKTLRDDEILWTWLNANKRGRVTDRLAAAKRPSPRRRGRTE